MKPGTNRGAVRRWFPLAVTACCSVVVGLGIAELVLRQVGRHPAPPPRRAPPNEPTMHAPDPILGWRVKPGRYQFAGYTRGAPPITMTFWPDGSRATSAEHVERGRRVVLIGDSFTQGWAISDDETYGWKLQARYPTVEFLNYGTAGYNGVQALLRLREHLSARTTAPDLVIYGFNDDQERRNVGEASWLQVLGTSAYRGTVRLPYCLLDGQGGLRTYPLEGYPMWPLRQDLAIAALLEESYFAFVTRHRSEQKRPVTERLMDEMDAAVRERGSRFLVVFLAGARDVRAHYATYLAERRIAFVDCAFGGGLTVPGEGHPNGLANTKWADCLGRVLDADLAGQTPHD